MPDRPAARVRRFKRRVKVQRSRPLLGVVDAGAGEWLTEYLCGGVVTREEFLADLTGGELVEPIDLTAPPEVLVAVPWTTPTTDENALARTVQLAEEGKSWILPSS